MRSYKKELLSNQLWHGLNFASKAAFLFLLTPLMLHTWGKETYGVFALASSLIVSMALADAGIRDATRLRLANALANDDDVDFKLALRLGLLAFGLIISLLTVATFLFSHFDCLAGWLNIPVHQQSAIVATVLLAGIHMLTTLALEPLAARNQLSRVMKANTVGALLAIPLVALLLSQNFGVLEVIIVYLGCLILPNLYLITKEKIFELLFDRETLGDFSCRQILKTYQSAGWMLTVNLSFVARSHLITLLIASLSNPATAGVFYIMLRISELISNLGASSAETLVASLQSARTTEEKTRRFRQACNYALTFCGFAWIGVSMVGERLAEYIFGNPSYLDLTNASLVGAVGFANAFFLFCFRGSIAMKVVPSLALGGMASAFITFIGSYFLIGAFEFRAPFMMMIASSICFIPTALLVAQKLKQSCYQTWIAPLMANCIPWLLCTLWIPVIQVTNSLLVDSAAVLTLLLSFFQQWRQLHQKSQDT